MSVCVVEVSEKAAPTTTTTAAAVTPPKNSSPVENNMQCVYTWESWNFLGSGIFFFRGVRSYSLSHRIRFDVAEIFRIYLIYAFRRTSFPFDLLSSKWWFSSFPNAPNELLQIVFCFTLHRHGGKISQPKLNFIFASCTHYELQQLKKSSFFFSSFCSDGEF